MEYLKLIAIFFSICYSLKKDKPNEKQHEQFLDDEWEPVVPESGQPERPWSIEILSHKNHPVLQKLESFSLN